jgi:hypothetical protein
MSGEELCGDARVFAGNKVYVSQHIESAQGDVAQVADRRRHHVKPGSKRTVRSFTRTRTLARVVE